MSDDGIAISSVSHFTEEQRSKFKKGDRDEEGFYIGDDETIPMIFRRGIMFFSKGAVEVVDKKFE